MEEERSRASGSVFQLRHLTNLYTSRLNQLGITSSVNSTRLKDRLLNNFSDLKASNEGKHVFLAFHNDIAFMLSDVHTNTDFDQEGLELIHVVNKIRKDVFSKDR